MTVFWPGDSESFQLLVPDDQNACKLTASFGADPPGKIPVSTLPFSVFPSFCCKCLISSCWLNDIHAPKMSKRNVEIYSLAAVSVSNSTISVSM